MYPPLYPTLVLTILQITRGYFTPSMDCYPPLQLVHSTGWQWPVGALRGHPHSQCVRPSNRQRSPWRGSISRRSPGKEFQQVPFVPWLSICCHHFPATSTLLNPSPEFSRPLSSIYYYLRPIVRAHQDPSIKILAPSERLPLVMAALFF
ncbi:hypothetical protein DL96DRAFT_598399 [Flagelloscypha sp. PMI_526]|nr:hypothetical protein DL96DRAFT_598399 [Flagelloscypha sp. PMI_526]